MRDAARVGEGSGGERGEGVRESAPFAITVADYRRAFVLAMESWEAPEPGFGERLAATFGQPWVRPLLLMSVAGSVVLAAILFVFHGALPGVFVVFGPVLPLFGAAWTASLLLMLVYQAWDEGGVRRRFPREQSAWKRPQRLRIRWDAEGLMLVGEDGFSSFGWPTLHAWINAPGEVVIFTGARDPVPVPHAVLTPDDLDDLCRRLVERDVPEGWFPDGDAAAGLRRVFA